MPVTPTDLKNDIISHVAADTGNTPIAAAETIWLAVAKAIVPYLGGGSGVTDGDKGDIIVSSGGTVWTIDIASVAAALGLAALAFKSTIDSSSLIDNGVVSTAKLGVDITAAGKAILDDANAAAQRTTLGLAAVAASGAAADVSGLAAVATSGSASDLGTGTLPIARIATAAVTLAKIADIATSRLLGRVTAGSGVTEELTPTQVTAMLNAFSSTLKGLVPASGGGTANFLRADGVFALPTDAYNGTFVLGSVALGASINNWDLVALGYAGESVIVVTNTTGGGTSITGINLGAYQVDGKVISIQQSGANAINYSPENASSIADNRIRANYTPGGQWSTITLRYTTRTGPVNRWIQI